MIWAVSILLFAIVFIIANRSIANKGDGYVDYSNSYQAKCLLTKNEWNEYKKLREYASEKGWIICPKVRVLDIIEPRKGQKNYVTLKNKIQSKHVDFVICDPDLRIQAILELDDNNHDKAERKNRDDFLNTVLQSVGYKVIHTRAVTAETLNFES